MDTAGVTTPADYANDAAEWIPYGLVNIANALTVDAIASFDFANADLVTAIGEYKTLLSNEKVWKITLRMVFGHIVIICCLS